jgi:PAS domain S-box-containing protein
MGVLIVAPVLLTWATQSRLTLPPWRVAEATLLLVGLIIVGEFVFGGFFINKGPNYPLAYLVFPFVMWAAFRFGQRGAVTATLVSAGMAVWSTAQGIGPFAYESLETSLILLHGFMGTIAITAMILAAAISERRQTEESLRASEERFRQVVLSISDHIYVSEITREEQFLNLYLSPHIETLTGYPVEKFMTDWAFWSAMVIHPDDKAAAAKQVARLLADQSGELEYRLVRANGEIIWVRDSVRVQPHDTSTLIYGVVSDITARRQAEEALRQSQERYRLLFEASPISLWEEDFSGVKNYLDRLRAEGIEDLRSYLESHPEVVVECAALVKIVDLNKAALELELRQEGSKEQFLQGLNQVFGPEAYHSFREELLTLAADQTEFETEKFSYTLAGDKKYLRVKSSIAPGSEETWSKVLVSVVDLTERKQAEEELQKYRDHLEELVQERAAELLIANTQLQQEIAERKQVEETLRESEAKLRILFEILPVGVTILDKDRNIVDLNPALTKILDVSREGLLRGKYRHRQYIGHDGTLMTPAEFPSTRAFEEQRAVTNVEIGLVEEDGLTIWTNVSATPLPVADLGVVIVTTDITERKRAEQRFRGLLESAPDAMVIVNKLGEIILVNSQMEKLFGYTRSELLGQTVELLLPERIRGQHFGYRAGYFANPQARAMGVGLELFALHRDSSEFPVEISLSPLQIEGEILVISAIRDITERKQAEARQVQLLHELESVNQELNDFAYIVSHDLKAPLRAIGSLANWIATDYAEQLGEEGQEQLNLLVGRVKRMHALIDGVLQYSRLGRSREERIEVNLNNLVAEVIDLLDPPSHIALKIENNLPLVVADKIRLQQLFQNLLNNAIKFMDKPQGQISVSYLEQADFWQFCVADNGPGIEAKHFAKIFQLFQTLSPRDEFESTGVGLTLVKKIVELHGGRIWIESKLGEGSAFFFTLPK